MKVGLGAGADYRHELDKIAIHAGGQVRVQLDSATDDMGETGTALVLHVPVMAMYQVDEKIHAGVATGVYTGDDLSFDANDNFTLPFVLGGHYAVNANLAAGAFFGFSSLVTQDGMGVADTLTFGAFAEWHP